MTVIIAFVSQKSGIGESTLGRLVAREYANAGWNVKIADFDVFEGTSFNWPGRHLQSSAQPVIPVERFGTVGQAVCAAAQSDMMILDAPPNSTADTPPIARAADIVILPTGLFPRRYAALVLRAHELVKNGVANAKIAFALCRVGDSHLELIEARTYITAPATKCWPGLIQG